MTGIRAEYDSAVETARHALEQFRAEPLVDSKRGGPRLSPWFRVWVQSSEIAQRWHRQLEDEPEPSIEETIHRILGPSGGEGGS